jgi:hypothetical protein
MTIPRSTAERAIIFGQPAKRQYGARLRFHVQHDGVIGQMENAAILLDSGAVVTLAPARQNSWEGGRNFELKLEGYSTATEAEAQGLKLSQAILWSSISLNHGVRLTYRTKMPATIFDRTASPGMTLLADGTVGSSAEFFLKNFKDGFAAPPTDPQTLLSMEIFCSSSLETSDRAAFLTAVSALEPLAQAQFLETPIRDFVNSCLISLGALPIDEPTRASLKRRIELLQRESIGQALRRTVSEKLPDHPTAAKVVSSAYSLRSKLIHSGVADYDIDLANETRKISALLRLLYARTLGLTPRVPALL